MNENESIELLLPCNAAYISAVRLTASSIAGRLKFAIDEIEDIKVAVSEACIFIIRELSASGKSEFKITFILSKNMIEIMLFCSAVIQRKADDIGIHMIRAVVDHFEISLDQNDCTVLVMKKKRRTDLFI